MNAANSETILGKKEKEILRLASLAPSGHNTQPWLVTIKDQTHWTIGTTPKRWLPAVDHDNHDVLLSIGAFLENLSIAAAYHGYKANIIPLAETPHDLRIADVILEKSSPETVNIDQIKQRRTLRKHYLDKPLVEGHIQLLKGEDANSIQYFTPGSPQSDYLNKATVAANRMQTSRIHAQEELADWIRWSNNKAEKYRDGLTPASMEIGGVIGWYVRNLYSHKDVLTASFRNTTMDLVSRQVKKHGGWFVITAKNHDVASLINVGRIMEKMYLKARDLGIALHPMSQVLQEKPFKYQVTDNLRLNHRCEFIFRAGYIKHYPEPISLKRPVAWFTQI